jgi:hypothetical protein
MPTKVSIIEVDLGEDIDKIISEDIAKLTQEAKQELDNVIEIAKKTQELKQRKEREKKESADQMGSLLDSIYNKLIESDKSGIPASEIVEEVKPQIKTASAFTLRMKTYLRNRGNDYIIKRKNIKKIPHYILEPYNVED